MHGMIGNPPIFNKCVHFFFLSKILSIPVVTDFYRFEITNSISSDGIRSSGNINTDVIKSFLVPGCVLST